MGFVMYVCSHFCKCYWVRWILIYNTILAGEWDIGAIINLSDSSLRKKQFQVSGMALENWYTLKDNCCGMNCCMHMYLHFCATYGFWWILDLKIWIWIWVDLLVGLSVYPWVFGWSENCLRKNQLSTLFTVCSIHGEDLCRA